MVLHVNHGRSAQSSSNEGVVHGNKQLFVVLGLLVPDNLKLVFGGYKGFAITPASFCNTFLLINVLFHKLQVKCSVHICYCLLCLGALPALTQHNSFSTYLRLPQGKKIKHLTQLCVTGERRPVITPHPSSFNNVIIKFDEVEYRMRAGTCRLQWAAIWAELDSFV